MIRCAVLLVSAAPSALAYDDAQLLHNIHCVSWRPMAEWARGVGRAIPAGHGSASEGICRSSSDATAMHACALSNETTELLVAVANESCRVWWHIQAFNALPLPLLTAWIVPTGEAAGASSLAGRAGLCATRSAGERRIGIVHADAKCVVRGAAQEETIEGDYDLLGAYDREQPYSFTITSTEGLGPLLAQLDRLVAELLTTADRDAIADVSGVVSWWPELRTLLSDLGQSFVYRVLSAERYIHHRRANRLGLHLLRCLLAERAIDASRALRGHTAHPDFDSFSQTGVLYKDFSELDHNSLRSLMAMVSGFSEATLPASVAWELRSTSLSHGDPNLDMHVDTFHPSQKMWLAVSDIDERHGPFNAVVGSHRNDESKLRWLYNVSNEPPAFGPGSYGSFRLAGNDPKAFGLRGTTPATMRKLTLFIADTSGLHARGAALPGAERKTMVPVDPKLQGGLPRRNPFSTYFEAFDEHRGIHVRRQCTYLPRGGQWFIGFADCIGREAPLRPNGPGGGSLPFECIAEGEGGVTCLFSLALSRRPALPLGRFGSRDEARSQCALVRPSADLAVLNTRRRNEAASRLVSRLREPHYLLADNPETGADVRWLDGSQQEEGFAPPWDVPSGQPNDCTGPASETCIFLGPRASWFDFPCSPYDPAVSFNAKTGEPATPGPEITWEDGSRREHNVAPLCQITFGADRSPEEVVAGWLAESALSFT